MVATMLYGLHMETQQFGSVVRPGPKTEGWIRDSIQQALGGDGVCLIAESGSEAVGCLLAVKVEWPYDSEYGSCALGLGTYVVPGWRGCGVADAFYKTAKQMLRERGFDSYVGAYLVNNTRVQKVLRRNGSKDLETTMVFDLRGE